MQKRKRNGFLGQSVRAIAALLALLQTERGLAETLLVSNMNDTGAGSLRQAIADNGTLGGGNTIVFSGAVTGTITLASQLVISTGVTILGPGAQLLTLSGNSTTRVFLITSGNVAISGLTVMNGRDAIQGNGIEQPAGSLTLSNCVITGCINSATEGGGIYSGASASLSIIGCTICNNTGFNGGGVVINGGNATICNSTICSNTATGSFISGSGGGGIHFRGGTLNISNSTIFANACSSSGFGGGILIGNTGTFNISSSTIASNVCSSGNGGGIQNNLGSAGAFVMNTIIAGNSPSSVHVRDCGGSFSSGGYNLIGETNGSSGWSAALQDQFGSTASPLDPKLGPLQSNGGPSPTMALLLDSPAVDKGNSFSLATDQRGRVRTYDFVDRTNASGGDGTDIGAFELQLPLLNIIRSGGNVVVSWSTNDSGFVLEYKTNLNAGFNWSNIPGSPAILGLEYVVTNSAVVGNKFYRLRSP